MATTVPDTGLRFTCTLNTFMKMESRGRGASPRPSSAGGTASTIGSSLPSAGQMIRPGSSGVLRSGSRKKATHQMVSGSSSQPSQADEQKGQQIHRREERDERLAFAVNLQIRLPKEKGRLSSGRPFNTTRLYQAARLPREGKGAEGAGLDAAGQLVAVDRAGEIQGHAAWAR